MTEFEEWERKVDARITPVIEIAAIVGAIVFAFVFGVLVFR
jgi:hypothetical protein